MKTQIISKPIGMQHPSVQRVIEIAEEIMGKNKVLTAEILYNIAKKRLKIPRNGLFSIIQFLINKKIIIEGSKFSKEKVLINQFRRRIYNFITTYPGIHFSFLRKKVLCDDLGTVGSSGQLVWHLEMLLKFKYIKKIKVRNYSVFLPFDMDDEAGKLFFLLRDKINNKLLNLLIEQQSIIKSEIYKTINEKRENVYYRLKNLTDYGLISLGKESNKKILINPNKKEYIFKILNKLKIK